MSLSLYYYHFHFKAGNQCFCGSDRSYSKYGRCILQSNCQCSTRCHHDTDHICGGGWTNSVFYAGKAFLSAALCTKYNVKLPLYIYSNLYHCWDDHGRRFIATRNPQSEFIMTKKIAIFYFEYS